MPQALRENRRHRDKRPADKGFNIIISSPFPVVLEFLISIAQPEKEVVRRLRTIASIDKQSGTERLPAVPAPETEAFVTLKRRLGPPPGRIQTQKSLGTGGSGQVLAQISRGAVLPAQFVKQFACRFVHGHPPLRVNLAEGNFSFPFQREIRTGRFLLFAQKGKNGSRRPSSFDWATVSFDAGIAGVRFKGCAGYLLPCDSERGTDRAAWGPHFP